MYVCLYVLMLATVSVPVGQDCYCTTCCDGCPFVTIPTTATDIATSAFEDCTTIQSIVIPTYVLVLILVPISAANIASKYVLVSY